MRIGIDAQHRIRQIGESIDSWLTVVELDETAPSYPFTGWTESRILSYCYKEIDGAVALYPFIDIDVVDRLDEHYKAMEALALAGRLTTQDLIRQDALSQEQLKGLLSIYPRYEVGKPYAVGDIVRYYEKLYEVLQAHTSQADWTPPAVPALYRNKMPEAVIPEWLQPTGAHDAYKIGDKVIFEGATYESLIDANVWTPTAYPQGWKKL